MDGILFRKERVLMRAALREIGRSGRVGRWLGGEMRGENVSVGGGVGGFGKNSWEGSEDFLVELGRCKNLSCHGSHICSWRWGVWS